MKTRCAWCCARVSGAVCDRCTSKVLPPEQFGAARMLVAAGIDRLALPDRIQELSLSELAAHSARFDLMWSATLMRVEEARSVESFLVQRTFADAVEDHLIALIPFSDDGLKVLGEGSSASDLEEIERSSPVPLNRALAAIALVHQRRITDARIERVRLALFEGDGPLAAEAAIALTRWFVAWTPGIPLLRRWDVQTIEEAARPLLLHASLAPYAAIAMRLGDRELLSRGMAADDADLRFACALALKDEAELARALDAGDEIKARAASDALGRTRSKLLHRRLAEGHDDRKLEIIKSLRHPAEAQLIEALLDGARNAHSEVRNAALAFLMQESYPAIPRESRIPIALFFARPEVGIERALEALAWAGEDAQLFAEAVTAQLERTSLDEIAKLLETHHRWAFEKWIVHAKSPKDTQVLDLLLGEPRVARSLLSSALNAKASDVIIAWWDRHDAGQICARLGEALRGAGSETRTRLAQAFWQRFKERDEDRPAIIAATQALRSELRELRSLEPRNGPFGTGDLVRFYETFAKVDPLEAPSLLGSALEEARQQRGERARDLPQLEALVDVALPHAIELVPTRPCTGLLIAARLASHVVNAYRERPDNEDLVRAVAALVRHYAPLTEAVDSARPIDVNEARYSGALEQLDTELRLARETEARAIERRKR